MNYVDGFVAAVRTADREAYRGHCEMAGPVFKAHGALAVVDCWGDDVPEGKLTSFPLAVKREEGETVVFGWIVWPSRTARDAGMAAAMADARFKDMQMPFDGRRMIFGGFETIAEC